VGLKFREAWKIWLGFGFRLLVL